MTPNETTMECLKLNLRRAANAAGKRPMPNLLNYSKMKAALVLSSFLLMGVRVTPYASPHEASSQHAFASPHAAFKALLAADKADDMKALSSILGPDADQ